MDEAKKQEIIEKIYEKLEKEVNASTSTIFDSILLEIVRHALFENKEKDFNPANYKKIEDFLAKPIDNTKTRRDEIMDYVVQVVSFAISNYADEYDLSEKETEELYEEAIAKFWEKYRKPPTEEIVSRIEKLPFEKVFKEFKEKAKIIQKVIMSHFEQAINASSIHELVLDMAKKKKINKFNMSNIETLKESLQAAMEEFSISDVEYYVSSELFESIVDGEVKKEILAYVRSLLN